jgi:hypothetical protein
VYQHTALQALAAAGTLGGAYLIATQDTPLPLYVALHPEAVWLIGPLLAAITGVGATSGGREDDSYGVQAIWQC